MAIDGLNQLSSEQLLAMSLMSNGQLTNNSTTSNSSSTSDEQNLAFQLVMKNLLESNNNSGNNVLNELSGSSSNSGATQQYATGTNLEDVAMILKNFNRYNENGSVSAIRSQGDMDKIYSAVKTASKKYGVDENLILAIIKQESNFDSTATSSCGAAGLMQVMPSNFSHTNISDGYDVDQNVNGGTKLFREYLDKYNGNIEMALMAYNGGPGTIQKRGVSSPSDLYKMPQETQNYVPKVMGYYKNGI